MFRRCIPSLLVTALGLAILLGVAVSLENREAEACARKGGVRVHTACLRKDVVLP